MLELSGRPLRTRALILLRDRGQAAESGPDASASAQSSHRREGADAEAAEPGDAPT